MYWKHIVKMCVQQTSFSSSSSSSLCEYCEYWLNKTVTIIDCFLRAHSFTETIYSKYFSRVQHIGHKPSQAMVFVWVIDTVWQPQWCMVIHKPVQTLTEAQRHCALKKLENLQNEAIFQTGKRWYLMLHRKESFFFFFNEKGHQIP